jgi:hypothetical protein
MKRLRLFPEKPIFYQGMEVVNVKNFDRGTVEQILPLDNSAVLKVSSGTIQYPIRNLIAASDFDMVDQNLTLAQIFYKGKGKPAVMLSSATLVIPCEKLIEYKQMFCKPEKALLRGRNKERFYDHMRRALVHLSWNGMTPENIEQMTEDDLEAVYTSEDFTFEKVMEKLLDVYKIEPCEICTLPITCDCRMRIVQQVKGDKAASYKTAQHAMREFSEPMAFWLKGLFRGRPRVRFMDYDVFIEESLTKDFKPDVVLKIINAIRRYEDWSGQTVSEEVTTTIQEAMKRLGYSNLDELEADT